MLSLKGTYLGKEVTKNTKEDIWELRPGNNRVFYFFYDGNTYVLLHHFRKKSQKTPAREIEQAIRERDDYLSRKRGEKIMTWEEYKAGVREKDPEMSREISEAEEVAKIVSELISQRNEKGLTQRQLAEICNMPQSSVARIESFQTSPRLDTLVKLTHSLGLRLTLTPNDN